MVATQHGANMSGIPIVDFSAAGEGTREEKINIARKIDDAFRNVGFVYLKNHGVPEEKVRECFEWVSATVMNHRP